MSEHDSDFSGSRAQALARLATLQRMKEQAKQGKRAAMLRSIEQLIEQEAKSLRHPHDNETDSAAPEPRRATPGTGGA